MNYLLFIGLFLILSLWKPRVIKLKFLSLEIFSNFYLTKSNSPTVTGCVDNISKSLISLVQNVQTGSGVHTSPYSVGNGVYCMR